MKLKKFLAAVLCAATLAGLVVTGPVLAVEPSASSFADITDPTVAEAAEFLRLLGVIGGFEDGTYRPDEPLTRAQFCRLAVDLRGEGAQAEVLMGYTFFKDVKSDHWARGYINYASRIVVGENERLVMGVGDGNFLPDQAITQAQAITMAMRLLGYAQKDVAAGSNWYDGYVASARTLGLLEGITLSPEQPLTRGNAALLFKNLLYAKPKSGDTTFFATLGGKIVEDVVLLSVNATTEDGQTGALAALNGEAMSVYKTGHAPFSTSLQGERVTLVLDKNGSVIDLRRSDKGTRRTVSLAAHEANYITDAAGNRLTVNGTTPLYRGTTQTTYGAVYMDLRSGSQLTLSYDVTGKLEYIYIPTSAEEEKVQAVTRLTCVYENASPSPKSPLTATVLNGTKLTVLPQASEELAAFTPGSIVSFLLTADGKIAGAMAPTADAKSTLVGVVTDADDGTATVETVMTDAAGKKFTFTGKVSSSAERLVGQLVTISSSRSGYLTLTQVSSSGAAGTLNVAQRTLGGEQLSSHVALYERTLNGTPQRISWGQITVASVPANKISYVGRDLSGAIDVIILDDVTGDGYTYGYLSTRSEEVSVPPLNEGDAPSSYSLYYVAVENSTGKHELRTLSSAVIRSTPGGMAKAANDRVGATVTLTAVNNVPRSAFDSQNMTVTVNGVTYPVSENVECCNRATNVWFGSGAEGLNAARAYADTLTIYYDKAPSQGGKVRLVTVG